MGPTSNAPIDATGAQPGREPRKREPPATSASDTSPVVQTSTSDLNSTHARGGGDTVVLEDIHRILNSIVTMLAPGGDRGIGPPPQYEG